MTVGRHVKRKIRVRRYRNMDGEGRWVVTHPLDSEQNRAYLAFVDAIGWAFRIADAGRPRCGICGHPRGEHVAGMLWPCHGRIIVDDADGGITVTECLCPAWMSS